MTLLAPAEPAGLLLLGDGVVLLLHLLEQDVKGFSYNIVGSACTPTIGKCIVARSLTNVLVVPCAGLDEGSLHFLRQRLPFRDRDSATAIVHQSLVRCE